MPIQSSEVDQVQQKENSALPHTSCYMWVSAVKMIISWWKPVVLTDLLLIQFKCLINTKCSVIGWKNKSYQSVECFIWKKLRKFNFRVSALMIGMLWRKGVTINKIFSLHRLRFCLTMVVLDLISCQLPDLLLQVLTMTENSESTCQVVSSTPCQKICESEQYLWHKLLKKTKLGGHIFNSWVFPLIVGVMSGWRYLISISTFTAGSEPQGYTGRSQHSDMHDNCCCWAHQHICGWPAHLY